MWRRRDSIEEYRAFTREVLLRLDRVIREFAAQGERHREETRMHREETRMHREETRMHREDSRRYFEVLELKLDRQGAVLQELLYESRAQRQALLSILDRLDSGGTAPAT